MAQAPGDLGQATCPSSTLPLTERCGLPPGFLVVLRGARLSLPRTEGLESPPSPSPMGPQSWPETPILTSSILHASDTWDPRDALASLPTRSVPASGPLHGQFPLPGTLWPRALWLAAACHETLDSSEKCPWPPCLMFLLLIIVITAPCFTCHSPDRI